MLVLLPALFYRARLSGVMFCCLFICFFFWGGGVAGVFSHIHWQVSSGKLKLGINDCLNKAGKLEETDERRDIPECLEMCCRA